MQKIKDFAWGFLGGVLLVLASSLLVGAAVLTARYLPWYALPPLIGGVIGGIFAVVDD